MAFVVHPMLCNSRIQCLFKLAGILIHPHLTCDPPKFHTVRHICNSRMLQQHSCSTFRDSRSKLNQWLGPRLSCILTEIEAESAATQQQHHVEEESSALKCPQATMMQKKIESDEKEEKERAMMSSREVELRHQWPEFMEFVDHLVQGGFCLPSDSCTEPVDVVDDVKCGNEDDAKVLRAIRNASYGFSCQRSDIIGSLSRRDIQLIVSSGCPNLNGKIVTSAKRLRAFVHVDEGDVCSACSFRSSCQRAYIVPFPNDIPRTFDIIRILVSYAFYPLICSSQDRKLTSKVIIASVRKLLRQVVDLSSHELDLPENIFSETSTKVKQDKQLPKKKPKKFDIEMKKGDWLCPRCDFMNFAKNKNCLQCHGVRPKPKLKLGEWECPGCGFINFRRNLACYKCECNRPQNENGTYDAQSNDPCLSNGEKIDSYLYKEWKWKQPNNNLDISSR